jgi:hypothetical protein
MWVVWGFLVGLVNALGRRLRRHQVRRRSEHLADRMDRAYYRRSS